jgi:biopolymer transport protein ExbD
MDFTAHSRKNRRQGAEINVTSLVDIIFNLLLFFMLTTSFSESGGIEVDLPKASTEAMSTSEQDLIIALTENGDVVVKNERVSLDSLGLELERVKSEGTKKRVIIQADRAVPHGRVVEIMDLIKEKGLGRIAIATESAP